MNIFFYYRMSHKGILSSVSFFKNYSDARDHVKKETDDYGEEYDFDEYFPSDYPDYSYMYEGEKFQFVVERHKLC